MRIEILVQDFGGLFTEVPSLPPEKDNEKYVIKCFSQGFRNKRGKDKNRSITVSSKQVKIVRKMHIPDEKKKDIKFVCFPPFRKSRNIH